MTTNYYEAPSTHADAILSQLGLDVKNIDNSFDPSNQPKEIGKQFHQTKQNKYQQQPQDQDNNDSDIPTQLLAVSSYPIKSATKNVQNDPPPRKGRKKQTKNVKKKKQVQKEPAKKQVSMEIDVNQVAEWGEKGTKANQDDDDEFDEDEDKDEDEGEQNTVEQQQIRKRIQQKLKKYESPGESSNKSKNTLGSLQSKAQQLKKINEQSNPMDQSSHQFLKDKPVKNQQKVQQKKQQQNQESEESDPWEKINQKTLADKKAETQALKNAEEMDINKYYQDLTLPDLDEDIEQGEEPPTGFFQNLCKCLSSKKKSITELEKQIIKLSKVQLSNKPEQITVLKSIWTKLTNKKYLRYGEHWSEIGFQGRDPATDLRSTGILSLIQWENFIRFDIEYCQKIHNFCTEFDIPLALSHIKVTSLLCSSIKKRQLDGKTWLDFLEWYYALSYYTFEFLMTNAKSLDQVGELVEKSITRTKNELQNAKKYFNKQIKMKR